MNQLFPLMSILGHLVGGRKVEADNSSLETLTFQFCVAQSLREGHKTADLETRLSKDVWAKGEQLFLPSIWSGNSNN